MTWSKDSYGLFDYQCKDAKKTMVESLESVELARHNDLIERKKPNEVRGFDPDEHRRVNLQIRIQERALLGGPVLQPRARDEADGPEMRLEGRAVLQRAAEPDSRSQRRRA